MNMKNEFKVGDFVSFGKPGKRSGIAYVIAIEKEMIHLLFCDNTRGWYNTSFGTFNISKDKWSNKRLEEIATRAFDRPNNDYYHLDNLTYIEILGKISNESRI